MQIKERRQKGERVKKKNHHVTQSQWINVFI